MYKLGVIGGMGPLATNEFYKRIIEMTPAKKDSEHIDTIILSHATLPDRTNSILTGHETDFINAIKNDFDILNSLQVSKIAIPCNTSHYFYDKFCEMTNIEIINMVEETVKRAKSHGYDKAYVFGTSGTLQAKVYEKYAEQNQLEILYIDYDEKKFVMDLIYDIKDKGVYRSKEFENLLKSRLNENTIGIIACTELSLLPLDKPLISMTIDALDVLVDKAVNL